jgi:hypothetical protein
MALRCISRYRSGYGAFEPGAVIDDPKLEAILAVDSPGSFEAVTPKQNKAMGPQATKAGG